MKGKFRFVIFTAIFTVLFGACLYGMAYTANILEDIEAGTYVDSLWSKTSATVAVWMFAAFSILSAAGIISGILRSKAVYVVSIVFFAALFALSGYLGFEHVMSMPWNTTREKVITLIMYIVAIVVSVIGVIINALALAKKSKT